jgi:predicted negative regulator of RcsB-dependent stress response
MNETTKAMISAIVVFICAIGGALGFDLTNDVALQFVSAIVFLVALGWGVWKNHNFTEAAQKGQALVDEIKATAKATKKTETTEGENND